MNTGRYYQQTASGIAHYLRQELRLMPGTHYQIRESVNGPRVIALLISVNPRYSSKIMGMAGALSQSAGLDKDLSIRIDRGRAGGLSVEIPKPRALWFNVSITQLPRRRGLKATVGLDVEHRPTLIDFANPLTPHGLVSGATGSGKTNTGRLLIYDLASQNEPADVQFVLIDTRKRGASWRPFDRLPHLAHPVITDDQTALKVLAWANAEVDRRATMRQTKPRVFVCIDEAQALLEQENFVRPIADLSSAGREFGIHMLLAMQNPSSKQLGDTTIKRNLSTRLVGKVDSADAAKVAAGVGGTGAERLMGAGDFLLVQPDGVRRLTVALLGEADIDRLPRVESTNCLDLEQYEDISHVLDQADTRSESKADPLEPVHVAYALAYPEVSQRAIYDQFKIGFPKIRRVQTFAADLLIELENLGFSVCPSGSMGDNSECNGATGATADNGRIA